MKLKKELIVEVDARRNTVNVFHEKSVLCGETIDAAMDDPKMEAIFANADVENYLDCIIRLVLEKNEEIEKLKHALRPKAEPKPAPIDLIEENVELRKLNITYRTRIECLQKELKHIATQAGRAANS